MKCLARITLLALVFLLVQCLRAQEQGSQPWRGYHSEKWGFCAAFPDGWQAEELFGRELLKAVPPNNSAEAEVTLGAFVNKHGEGEGPEKSLEAIAEDGEDDLRDSMVKNLRSANESVTIASMPGLVTRQSYIKGGEPFLAKEVRVRRDDGVVIELMLRAPDDQFAPLESSFDQMLKESFRPTCTKLAK